MEKTHYVQPDSGFVTGLADAYDHLYDLVYLRTHPLLDLLVPEASESRKSRAWAIHQMLLDVIEELNPGPQAPAFSLEWRRYRLMVLRYADGLDTLAVANELGISRRHYYREHEVAMQAVASILWERYGARTAQHQHEPPLPPDSPTESLSHLELLRLEAARVTRPETDADLSHIVQELLALLTDTLKQRDLSVQVSLPKGLPHVEAARSLLRQLLMGALGQLIEHARHTTLHVVGRTDGARINLRVMVAVIEPGVADNAPQREAQITALEELAALVHGRLVRIEGAPPVDDLVGPQCEAVTGFEISLPIRGQRTVLVVDDNEDVIELFERILTANHYRVLTAQTAEEAIRIASEHQPDALTLDLMMPDTDGWDVLQTLLNRPMTQHIPIIVCSVLKQKELALMLGATLFLEKPVTEQALISALKTLTL